MQRLLHREIWVVLEEFNGVVDALEVVLFLNELLAIGVGFILLHTLLVAEVRFEVVEQVEESGDLRFDKTLLVSHLLRLWPPSLFDPAKFTLVLLPDRKAFFELSKLLRLLI